MELAKVVVFAKDMAPMIRFYGDVLGLTLTRETLRPDWAEFAAGGAGLALHAVPPDIAATIDVADPPRPRADTPLKVVFRVADVAAERARLVERGVVMFALRPWGACDGLDPEGNVFQIAEG